MSSLTVFQFESKDVRFVDGKPVANDVAAVLGYKNSADAVYRLVKSKNKGLCDLQTPGGIQSVTVLEEAGIYQLIFSSKLETAERFQDWVFEEVLPSIRKTGSYSVQHQVNVGLQKALEDGEALLKFNTMYLQPIGVDQAIINAIAIEQVQEANPQYAKILQPTRNALNNAIVPDTPLTPTQIGEQIGLSAIKVNQLLIEKGLQTKNQNKKSRKEPTYLPTTKGSEWAVQTTSKGMCGDNTTYYQLRWYPSVLSVLQ